MWVKFKAKLLPNLYQLFGWRTDQKIVVIESDDWGAHRMRDRQTRDILEKLIGRKFQNPFDRLDCLEQDCDLEQILDTLAVFAERSRPPIITLNTIVANPDFERIKAGNFQRYYFRELEECYQVAPNSGQVLSLTKEGISKKLFQTQFHGREHLQVNRWLQALQRKSKDLCLAFDREVYGISTQEVDSERGNYMAAYEVNRYEHTKFMVQSIGEGLDLFEKTFGFRAKSAIAPAAVWNEVVEKIYKQGGVEVVQGFPLQYIPQLDKSLKKKYHYTGELSPYGQIYLTRNCYFEPSTKPEFDWVSNCLKQISRSFLLKKPAIISSHRINFVGGIKESNRTKNLLTFKLLLEKIYGTWPDVIFLSSDQLGRKIQKQVLQCVG